MRIKSFAAVFCVAAITIFISSCKKNVSEFCNCNPENIVATVSVYATGLNNPRGLKFGPDGDLYVAEGGYGGADSSTGLCMQVPAPVGPYTGSDTGARITRISHDGTLTTVADNIPSSQTSVLQGSLVQGVADVAFLGDQLYGILSGAGCSHGVPNIPNGVIRVKENKNWTMIANLSAFQQANPVAHPNPPDFEPDGTWYSMVQVGGDFYALEPNHGELDRISPSGTISRVIDISAFEGHIVPTSVVFHNGNFYMGNLSLFPIVAGRSNVYKITPSGQISVFATGFTMVTGITFDKLGGLYVLENTTGNPFPTPGTGDIVRVDPSGSRTTVTTGLNLPTAMTFGPDDKLYVSVWGFGPPPIGQGQVLQLNITCAHTNGVVK